MDVDFDEEDSVDEDSVESSLLASLVKSLFWGISRFLQAHRLVYLSGRRKEKELKINTG